MQTLGEWRASRGAPDLPHPKRCRELRRKARLTQEDLAQYLGVSRVAVSLWERGRYSPAKGERRARYARLLDSIQHGYVPNDLSVWMPPAGHVPEPDFEGSVDVERLAHAVARRGLVQQ